MYHSSACQRHLESSITVCNFKLSSSNLPCLILDSQVRTYIMLELIPLTILGLDLSVNISLKDHLHILVITNYYLLQDTCDLEVVYCQCTIDCYTHTKRQTGRLFTLERFTIDSIT